MRLLPPFPTRPNTRSEMYVPASSVLSRGKDVWISTATLARIESPVTANDPPPAIREFASIMKAGRTTRSPNPAVTWTPSSVPIGPNRVTAWMPASAVASIMPWDVPRLKF